MTTSPGDNLPLDNGKHIVYLDSVTPKDLKQWREKHGYTQVTLARVLGVHEITVSRWERGFIGIPPFLRLALEKLECKGGEKDHGKHLQAKEQ